MNMENLKIAIIGAGPSGGILGAYLARKNIDVTLVDVWKSHMEAIQKKGLEITGVENFIAKFDSDNLKLSISDLKDYKLDIVFIAVKTPFLPRVAEDLKQVISDKTFVVSHQNGIGTDEYLASVFGKERALRFVINYAGNMIGPGKIDMTFFNPPNDFGAQSTDNNAVAREIADLISKTGLTTVLQEDIQPAVWKKAILNAALAGLCAITQMTMREAMDFEDTSVIVSHLIKEGIAVAEALGYSYGPGFHDGAIAYLSKGGHHKPSMLIDIESRRPSEVAFLNEKIVDVGREKGIPTPYNESVTSVIKALDIVNKKRNDVISEGMKKLGLKATCRECAVIEACITSFKFCPYLGELIAH
ncbi:MAG: ketopantoate reductase family protein [Candidatus Odinarchaeota archaeon]